MFILLIKYFLLHFLLERTDCIFLDGRSRWTFFFRREDRTATFSLSLCSFCLTGSYSFFIFDHHWGFIDNLFILCLFQAVQSLLLNLLFHLFLINLESFFLSNCAVLFLLSSAAWMQIFYFMILFNKTTRTVWGLFRHF